MDELKLIFASNLIRLRTATGMTQAELGEQLNYSDKSISKWERGEAIPDAAVLKHMSEIFGVTVDYLLNEHDAWQPGPEPSACDRSHHAIILVALMGIVTLAVLVFVVLWLWLGSGSCFPASCRRRSSPTSCSTACFFTAGAICTLCSGLWRALFSPATLCCCASGCISGSFSSSSSRPRPSCISASASAQSIDIADIL